ncbi:MAG: hypothetical protein HW384_1153 [Dehalococcoidia bacterium]|nr:hypothetical protein [Dehalococcoidia bacterium]
MANDQFNLYEVVKKKLKASADKLEALHPFWVPNNDARISWFLGAINVLVMTQIECLVIAKYLSRKDWWQGQSQISGDLETVPIFLNEYDIHIRLWTFHSIFFQLEESLRQVIKLRDPVKYNECQTNWPGLYNFLLKETGLTKYCPLFKLIAHTRNTIHNNGVFRPPNGKDVDIEWEGKMFQFCVDRRIRWFTHDTLRQFIIWLNQVMLDIMLSETVGTVPKIERFKGE